MRTRRDWARIIAAIASLTAAGVFLGAALPAIAGVGWPDIAAQLGNLSTTTVVGLFLLWLVGLWTYTFVLTSSLPGLSHGQAFALNCAGSAVSNVLPFGGAAGAAVTFAMAGSWGHRRSAIAVSTLVSGAWNILSRLALPTAGLVMLLVSGSLPDNRLTIAVEVSSVLLGAGLVLVVACLASQRTFYWVGRVAGRLAPVLPVRARPAVERVGVTLSRFRRDTIDLIRSRWVWLTLGMLSYLTMQFLLFWACLSATSTNLGPAAMVAAFALSRFLATAAVTPGGIGVTESGTVALLIALGAPAAPAAAGLLLFGFFAHAVEIPVGGAVWAGWVVARRWRARRQARHWAPPVEPTPVAGGRRPVEPAAIDAGPD